MSIRHFFFMNICCFENVTPSLPNLSRKTLLLDGIRNVKITSKERKAIKDFN